MFSPTFYDIFYFHCFVFVASTNRLRCLVCEFSFCAVDVVVGEWSETEDCDNVLVVGTLLEVGKDIFIGGGVRDLVTGGGV